jgi:hypothetical protein
MTTVVVITVTTCRHPILPIAVIEVPNPNAPMAISRPQFEMLTKLVLIGA